MIKFDHKPTDEELKEYEKLYPDKQLVLECKEYQEWILTIK